MKKFLKKHAKTIIKTVLIWSVAIVAYIVAHKLATAERGYEAVGGEIFVPVLIIFAEEIRKILKAPFVNKGGANR